MVIFAVFSYWPLARTFTLSTQETDLFGRPAGFVGAENYIEMFSDPNFTKTVITTVLFVIFDVAAKLIVGLLVAVPLSTRLVGSGLLRPIVLIPMAFSVAVAGVVFKTMYRPGSGTFDQVLGLFGITGPGWLTDPQWALISVIIVDVWVSLGMVVLLLLAALDGVPKSVLEAAAIEGATGFKATWFIQIPLITPTIFFIMVTQTVAALRQFTLINILTGGGPDGATRTLVVDLYTQAFGTGANYGGAAARGVVLMLVVGTLSFLQFRMGERKVTYQ